MICVNDENTENEECVVLTHNFDYHGEDDNDDDDDDYDDDGDDDDFEGLDGTAFDEYNL